MSLRPALTVALIFLVFFACDAAKSELAVDQELEVMILWDNSGSMYPGYRPAGYDDRVSLEQSGGQYYFEYPAMGRWLEDLVALQTILGGSKVSFATFTSNGRTFLATDIDTHVRGASLDEFSFQSVRGRIPSRGNHTFLTQSLLQGSRSFEGVVWLITDNIVEDRKNVPAEGVQEFFRTLYQKQHIRSVHLYKLPFDQLVPGAGGTLAVYGILVSRSEVSPHALLYFDGKFRKELLGAAGPKTGRPLFQAPDYWKLKDLSVGAMDLEIAPQLRVEIVDQERGFFRESQKVRLRLSGSIYSRLTQHHVTAGSYTIRPKGDFRVRDETLGIEPVPPGYFGGDRGTLPPIPPRQSVPIDIELVSKQPIRLETDGIGSWFRSAFGLTVIFEGAVQAEFESIEARFDSEQMAGIFGAEAAPEIFGITERIEVTAETSNVEPISFPLTSSYGRQLMLVLLLLVIALFVSLVAWLALQREGYRIEVGGDERVAYLRRLRPEQIAHQGQALGRLTRKLWGGGAEFAPSLHVAGVSVVPSRDRGSYNVTLRDGETTTMHIERVSGGGGVETAQGRGRSMARAGSVPRPGSGASTGLRSTSAVPGPSPPRSPSSEPSASPSPAPSTADRRQPPRPSGSRIKRPK